MSVKKEGNGSEKNDGNRLLACVVVLVVHRGAVALCVCARYHHFNVPSSGKRSVLVCWGHLVCRMKGKEARIK